MDGKDGRERASQLLLYFLDLVALDDVLLLDVVVAIEADAALEALGDVLHVLLEALERRQLSVPQDGAVSKEARLGRALDRALGDVAASDRDPLDLEEDANLRSAVLLLDERRGKEPLHRALHVVHRVVDDRVEANLDLVLFGESARLARGSHVEADDDGPRRDGEVDVPLGDRADA